MPLTANLPSDADRYRLCAAARRLFAQGHVVGNEGNLSYRHSNDRILCTPTARCKGLLEPEELSVVDAQGRLIHGPLQPTSEIQLHLEVYRQRPEIRYVVHAHPPHVLAFALAREAIPQGVLPEIDFFLGDVPIAPYKTPGGIEFARTILPFVHRVDMIVLASHGTVTYSSEMDLAIANTEMLDRYCYILLQASQLGRIHFLSAEEVRDLLKLKASKNLTDTRDSQAQDHHLFGQVAFRDTWSAAHVEQRLFSHPSESTDLRMGLSPPEVDVAPTTTTKGSAGLVWSDLIEQIATRVAEKLRGG